MPSLRKVRGEDCSDGRTCPALYIDSEPHAGPVMIRAVARPVTDPAVIAQMNLGPGEVAVEFPLSLAPEVADGA